MPYIKQFVKKDYVAPTDLGVISNILNRKQALYDKGLSTVATLNNNLGSIQSQPNFIEARNSRINNINQEISDAVAKRGGDYGDALSDIVNIASTYKKDPFFNLNAINNQNAAEIAKIKMNDPNRIILNDPSRLQYNDNLTANDLAYQTFDSNKFIKDVDSRIGGAKSRLTSAGSITDNNGNDYDITHRGLTDAEVANLTTQEAFDNSIQGLPQYEALKNDPQAYAQVYNNYVKQIQSYNLGETRTPGMNAYDKARLNALVNKSNSTSSSSTNQPFSAVPISEPSVEDNNIGFTSSDDLEKALSSDDTDEFTMSRAKDVVSQAITPGILNSFNQSDIKGMMESDNPYKFLDDKENAIKDEISDLKKKQRSNTSNTTTANKDGSSTERVKGAINNTRANSSTILYLGSVMNKDNSGYYKRYRASLNKLNNQLDKYEDIRKAINNNVQNYIDEQNSDFMYTGYAASPTNAKQVKALANYSKDTSLDEFTPITGDFSGKSQDKLDNNKDYKKFKDKGYTITQVAFDTNDHAVFKIQNGLMNFWARPKDSHNEYNLTALFDPRLAEKNKFSQYRFSGNKMYAENPNGGENSVATLRDGLSVSKSIKNGKYQFTIKNKNGSYVTNKDYLNHLLDEYKGTYNVTVIGKELAKVSPQLGKLFLAEYAKKLGKKIDDTDTLLDSNTQDFLNSAFTTQSKEELYKFVH